MRGPAQAPSRAAEESGAPEGGVAATVSGVARGVLGLLSWRSAAVVPPREYSDSGELGLLRRHVEALRSQVREAGLVPCA